MSHISVTDARARLPELLVRVEAGEEVTLTRHGRDVAVLVRPDVLKLRKRSDLFTSAASIGEGLRVARTRPIPENGLSTERAEELVAAIRADRDSRG